MKRFVTAFLVALGSIACSQAASAAVPSRPAIEGYAFVKEIAGIAEYKMSANDLNVLLLEDHSAPVLTFMVTYRVGSRNEVTGTTGATHLLEHLMFKGSRNFNAGNGKAFDTMMDKVGGINNASTWLDRTNYYENLPSDHLELAVNMEADRMRYLLLREEDRQPEMTVVRNEFERGENDPVESLDKEVNAAAFIAHPYHHPTIGWRSDIEKVSIAKLREFYDTFYWPNNATITVIGDFQPANALKLVQQYFGKITRSPKPIPAVYTEEPAQTGPRRVIVKRPGEVGVVQLAYKVPRVLHADHAPLEVLAGLLSEGKTSRLYRALIDTNFAISADASKGFFHDDTLFTLSSMLAPGKTHDEVEKILLAEIEKVKKDGVTAAEVSRAINKLIAGIAYRRDGSFAIAGHINEAIAVGDWTVYSTLLEKLKAVTPADIQRVAQAYFLEDQSTTGWFIPQMEPADAKPQAGTADLQAPNSELRTPNAELRTPTGSLVAFNGPHYYRDPLSRNSEGRGLLAGDFSVSSRASPLFQLQTPSSKFQTAAAGTPSGGGSGPALVAPRVQRRKVAGIDVLTLKTSIKDVITLRGVIGAGDVFNPPDNSAIADLTAGMIDKGTVNRDKFAVAELLEEAGATLSFSTGTHTLNFSGKMLRKDLTQILNLLAEQLRTPRLDREEFAKLKTQVIGRYKRALEDTDFRADHAFERAIFPAGHPNRPPPDEKYLADVADATLEQLQAFHAANYGPAAARIVIVGDVDDAAIDAAITATFAGWQGGRPIPPTPKASALAAARTEKVPMPGKTSVSFVIGQPSGLRYADPDYQPLNMATSVLGSGFFSARLLDIIRNKEGLTYGIGASLGSDTYNDGSWSISGTFAPELLDKGVASTLRELRRFANEGLTAAELENFKTTLTGSYKVALSTTNGLAGVLLNALQRGYGPEWVDEYPRRLHALTLAEVNASIKKYVHPDKMVTVMAGTLPEDKK